MHANAKLAPIMRAKMIHQLTSEGLSLRATAALFHVSEKTVRRWLARARTEGFPSRLLDRSSSPRRQPRRTPAKLEASIPALRHQRRPYAPIPPAPPPARKT